MNHLSSSSPLAVNAFRIPALSIGLVLTGCAVVDYRYILAPVIFGGCTLSIIAAALVVRSKRENVIAANDSQSIRHVHSEEAARMVQDLFGPYPRYAAAAAEHLGVIREAGAVPSLISVLDRSAWRSEDGWGTVCEAIVEALAKIGDGRALPVLNRVQGARGADFSIKVNAAIASMTSLDPAGLDAMANRRVEVLAPLAPASAVQTGKPRRLLTADFEED